MTDYDKLVKALRCCADDNALCEDCPYYLGYMTAHCQDKLHADAADAIEALQADNAENGIMRKNAHGTAGLLEGQNGEDGGAGMSVELKPCPFCGRERGGLFIETDEIGWHFVVCAPSDGGCGASGPGGVDDDHAEELWNRRAEPPKEENHEGI